MSLTEKLEMLVELNPKSAIKGLTQIGTTAEKQLGKVNTKSAQMGKTLSHVGVGMIGVGAVITGVLFEAARAADEAEVANLKLDNSIRNSGKVAESAAPGFKKLAYALEGKTEADHVSIIAAEASLVQFRATAGQVKTLTPLVVDLARKQGVDLLTATKAVGKAINGTSGGLSRMGVVIDKNAFATDHYAATVDALRHTVGGFAETEGKTFEGQLTITKNKLKDLEQGVGSGALIAFEKLLGPVQHLSDEFAQLSPGTQSAVGEIGAYSAFALIAAGSTATLVGKLVAAKTNFAALSEEMPLVAGGLGIIGKAGLTLAALDIGVRISNAINPLPHANLNKLSSSLLDFSKSGRVTGEAAKFLGGDFTKLNHAIEAVAAPSNATKLGHLSDEITGGFLGAHTPLVKARADLDGLDKSITNLYQQDPKAATAVLDAIRTKIGDKNFNLVRPLFNDLDNAMAGTSVQSKLAADGQSTLADKLGTTGVAASTAAEDFVKLAGITGKNIDPVKELDNALDSLISKLFGIQPAQDAYQHDLNQLPTLLKDAVTGHIDLKNALTDTSDAGITFRAGLRQQVTDGEATIKSLIEQGGTTDDVKYRVGQLAQEWVAYAEKAKLPQSVIQDTYDKLIALSQLTVAPTVDVNTDAANAKIDALSAKIAALRLGSPVSSGAPLADFVTGGGPTKPAPKKKGHAAGGRLTAGSWVGERGPEWFEPDRPGYVLNHGDAMRAAAMRSRFSGAGAATTSAVPPVSHTTITANVHVGWTGAATGKQIADALVPELRKIVRTQGGDVQRVLGANR